MRPSTLHRLEKVKPTGQGVVIGALHPAYRSGRTIFPTRVFDVDEVGRVLKDGFQSRKIGKVVTKGARRGWPIYTLTLEERTTCPRTCKVWGSCYGNGMHAAERIVAGPALEQRLWDEILQLQFDHPAGFMVRLHILGDFYSLDYVRLWERALQAFPALHVFGFTARDPDTDPIGRALFDLVSLAWDRFAVRFSGREGPIWASRIGNGDPEAITCPAQLGKTDCCATCALCWQSERSIAFLRH